MPRAEPQPDINDFVVRSLYEAAAGVIPWSDALGRLHREMQCAGVQLVVVDKSNGKLLMSEQSTTEMIPVNVDGVLDHVREYHRHDPHMTHTATLPVGKVMHSVDAFPIEKWANHVFYRDYWSAYGLRELFAAKLAEDDRHLAMIGMTRTRDMSPYTPTDSKLFERYIGHLATAYHIVRHLGIVQTTAQAGLALIEASYRPIILMDTDRTVVARNKAARRILDARQILFESAGRLQCRTNEATVSLTQALSNLDIDDPRNSSGHQKPRSTVRLVGLAGEILLCSLWGMKPSATMGVFGSRPVVLLTIVAAPGDLDAMYIASMFDLSPAETRLAVALAEGLSLQATAAKHSVSIETVRTQLKSIFTKTKTRRQSELIALLLHCTS